MAYTKTNWINDSTPAINADNLNKIEQGIYDNAEDIINITNQINDVSIAQLMSNGTATVPLNTEIKITGIWTSAFQFGDYTCDVANSRIVVTNTEILETSGLTGGTGKAWNGIVVKDENDQNVNEGNNYRVLNTTGVDYWSLPFPTSYYKLDKTKTYYVYLHCYASGENFLLNNGMGDKGTVITARKIK